MIMEHLHRLYPEIVQPVFSSKMKEVAIEKRVACLCSALECVRHSWMMKKKELLTSFVNDKNSIFDLSPVEQLVDMVLATLDCVIKSARELFDLTEEKDAKAAYVSRKIESHEKCRHLIKNEEVKEANPEMNKIQNPVEKQKSSVNDKPSIIPSKPAPPPPFTPAKGPVPLPPPPAPIPCTKGGRPPPPPPFGGGRKVSKLKRSNQMSSMFQNVKRKMESSGLEAKSIKEVKKQIGGSAGGSQGLAASLAELTKRSPYFQQIEEDVQKHAKLIVELKAAISAFQSKDMVMLIKFQKNVESVLEALTDETQVLSRFEDFPAKKLEALRGAAALYSKLDAIVFDLKRWEVKPPLEWLLDKFEAYFSKLKKEVDALERIKDEELKKFTSQGIHFDFEILTKIKELTVDASSSCMELALKERVEAKVAAMSGEPGPKNKRRERGSVKLLWRTLQLAFRVYLFAGGQDDRADKLAKELANEILVDS